MQKLGGADQLWLQEDNIFGDAWIENHDVRVNS